MNPLLNLIKQSSFVPIPQSTETDKTYWFANNGTVSESCIGNGASSDAIVINANDPVTKQPIGGIAYIIHNDSFSKANVNNIASNYSQHPHVVAISEWHAAQFERNGEVNWDMCLTPVKVLGIVQEGYR